MAMQGSLVTLVLCFSTGRSDSCYIFVPDFCTQFLYPIFVPDSNGLFFLFLSMLSMCVVFSGGSTALIDWLIFPSFSFSGGLIAAQMSHLLLHIHLIQLLPSVSDLWLGEEAWSDIWLMTDIPPLPPHPFLLIFSQSGNHNVSKSPNSAIIVIISIRMEMHGIDWPELALCSSSYFGHMSTSALNICFTL